MNPEDGFGDIAKAIDRLAEWFNANLTGLREELVRIEEAIRDTASLGRRDRP